MNHKQKVALDRLQIQLLNKVPEGYEFKTYDVENLSRSISVYAELGPPDSADSMAEVLCHFHFLVTIGPRGGTRIRKM